MMISAGKLLCTCRRVDPQAVRRSSKHLPAKMRKNAPMLSEPRSGDVQPGALDSAELPITIEHGDAHAAARLGKGRAIMRCEGWHLDESSRFAPDLATLRLTGR
jgi:hypothetical protein